MKREVVTNSIPEDPIVLQEPLLKKRNVSSVLFDTKADREVTCSETDSNDEDDIVTHRTVGLVFEAAVNHVAHRLHKERPARVQAIREALVENQILEQCRVFSTQPDILKDEDFQQVHRPCYVNRLNKLSGCSCAMRLDREASQYASIYLTSDSVTLAKTAAAALCTLAMHVLEGTVQHGFAVIRPPGHHAEPSVMGGYCLLNNVAIATTFAQKRRRRVAIIDWDVHHGNGTQSIFYDDPHVLYFSVHRSNFYPFTGKPSEVGAQGRNVNVAWTSKGMGDAEYLCVWHQLLLPMLQEFQPDLVFVSAGFDAAQGDMGECNVTPKGFGTLTQLLVETGYPIVCALEGGYVRSILGACVNAVVGALLTLQPPAKKHEAIGFDQINPVAARDVQKTIAAHRSHWRFLQ